MPCPARHLMTLLLCGLALLACGSDAADGASVLDATDAPATDTPSGDDGQAAPDAASGDDGQAAPDAASGDDGQAAPDAVSDDDGLTAPDAPCSADCDSKTCGDDGCGGSCGTCDDGVTCGEDGQCVCVPGCEWFGGDKQCGDDGCGGSCGDCSGPDDHLGGTCNASGQCECYTCQEFYGSECHGIDYGPWCAGTLIEECFEGWDYGFECASGCVEADPLPYCIAVCGDGECNTDWGDEDVSCPEDCGGCQGVLIDTCEGTCWFVDDFGDGTCDAVFDCAELDHDGGDCEAPPPGCEPTGPGQYVQEVQVVPASPDDCTQTSIVLSGVHPGLNHDFGTTNTGVCQPPFNCGASEAIVTLNLTATVHPDNPPGPDYEATFDLGTLEAYTYCVRVLYGASQGVSEEIKTSVTVSACD